MKNFTSILALIALSAGVVTSRALPVGDGLVARVPYPIDTTKLSERIPKKDKEHNAANSTISAATSLTSSTSGDKKKGKGKGAAHSAAQNGTAAADTGKKGKGGANSASQDKGAANANDAAAAQSGESGVDSIVQSLTGINLGSLGLRSPLKLEARKGKEAATPVASGVAAVGTGKSAAKKVKGDANGAAAAKAGNAGTAGNAAKAGNGAAKKGKAGAAAASSTATAAAAAASSPSVNPNASNGSAGIAAAAEAASAVAAGPDVAESTAAA